jgi:hypothetical protein
VRKKYRVEVSAAAKEDIRSAFDHIAAANRQAAERWVENVEQLIFRCAPCRVPTKSFLKPLSCALTVGTNFLATIELFIGSKQKVCMW